MVKSGEECVDFFLLLISKGPAWVSRKKTGGGRGRGRGRVRESDLMDLPELTELMGNV